MTPTKNIQPQKRRSRPALIRKGLLLVMAGLAILTGYLFYSWQPHYKVQVFNTSSGWGYDILDNGKPFIHQPTIPGVPGVVGFTNSEQAQRVGERVVEKLQEEQAMPTLTHDELRQLGVTIP
ncbi:DUF4907 domain-containing protein [Spirosoma aureum]|uniref:DUF4907 domain-containing protein n=1 Tax=Spirosoma aureum TaxID=2692134 RepID=UPI001E44F591|nr:DUF4907 domain-containing protein [Spirosoma aureum]